MGPHFIAISLSDYDSVLMRIQYFYILPHILHRYSLEEASEERLGFEATVIPNHHL